jgi:hypothetical protein
MEGLADLYTPPPALINLFKERKKEEIDKKKKAKTTA